MSNKSKTMTLAQLSESTTNIGRKLRSIGWLMEQTREGFSFTNNFDNAFIDLGTMIKDLGEELINLEDVAIVDHADKQVK